MTSLTLLPIRTLDVHIVRDNVSASQHKSPIFNFAYNIKRLISQFTVSSNSHLLVREPITWYICVIIGNVDVAGMYRGLIHNMWVGVLTALPSGAGVALAILAGSTESLVGVAISAALLEPSVNAVRSALRRAAVSLTNY